MSTTIDERVVEMRFDNKHFESNVATSMSTLEKLKQKLNLDGATKGLEKLNYAAKNNNLSVLGDAANTVGLRFNAMYTMADQALRNITTRVQQTAESTIKAFTIDPVKTGLNEYETKMGSIQTILANTEHQGTTLDDVTAALDELNLYADKTIYNFQEMTRNIGTFTAAGVDLGTSVSAIQGIANLAAVSGSTSQQASTAMYQLSQALATGTVKLMDWNSVVNAGMGGKVFQNALIQTAAMLDGAAEDVEAWQKENIDSYGSFRDSLSQGAWLTSEVLTQTLKQFTMAAEEGSEEWEEFKKSLMATGYTETQAEEILKMANTATDAATKVKTFTQLMDTLRESAQSGWAQTWETILGDFEEAKEFFTGLSDLFGGIIGESANRRNNFLTEALGSNWDKLIGKINEAGIETSEFEESIRKIVGDDKLDSLIEDFGSLEKAIREGGISSDILKKALSAIGATDADSKIDSFVEGLNEIERKLGYGSVGDDVKDLQTALEALGHSVGECGIDGIIGPDTTAAIKEFQKEVGLAVDGVAGPETLAAMKKAGARIDETKGEVDDLSGSCEDLVDAITKKSGRELLLESLMNVIHAIHRPLAAVGEALRNTFSISPDQLYNALESLNKFTSKFVMKGVLDATTWDELISKINDLGIETEDFSKKLSEVLEENGVNVEKLKEKYGSLAEAFNDGAISMDTIKDVLLNFDGITESMLLGGESADKVRRAFEGLFAILDIIGTIASGGVKVAFKVLTAIFDKFGMSALDVAANVGDALVAFRDWLFEENLIAKSFDRLIDKIPVVVDKFKAWFAVFKETPAVQKLVDAIEAIGEAFDKLTSGEISISEFAASLGENLAKALKSLPEIALQVGKDFIAGFQNGIGDSASGIINKIVEFCLNFIAGFKEALGVQSPSWKAYDTATDFFQGFINGVKYIIGSVLDVLKNVGEQIVKVFKSFWDYITDESGNIEWDKIIAGGIIVVLVLMLKKIADAFNILADGLQGINGILSGAGSVLNSFSKTLNAVAFDLKAEAIKKLAFSIAILVACIILIAQVEDTKKLWNAVAIIGALALIVVGLAWAMGKMSDASLEFDAKSKTFKSSGIQKSLLQIGLTILALAYAVKLIGELDAEEAKQGFIGLAGVAAGLIIFMAAMGGITRYSGDTDTFGKMVLKIAVAMGIMVLVMKAIAKMTPEDILIGIIVMEAFALLVMQMGIANRIAASILGDNFGGNVLKISIAMGIMALVMKIISGMDPEDILVGVAALQAFVILIGELALINRLAGQNESKIGGTVMSMAGSILILTGVIWLLSKMDEKDVIKGIAVTEAFVAVIATMILASKIAGKESSKIAGNILAMSTAIAILAGVAILLSLIELKSLAKGIIAVSVLGLIMATMIKSLKGAQNVKGSLIAMTVAIGIMAASVVALSFIDTKDLAVSAGAMVAMMGAFALMMKSLKGLKKGDIPTKALIMLSGVVLLIAGIIAVLSHVIKDPLSAVVAAGSVAIVLLSLATALKMLNGVKLELSFKQLQSMALVVLELAVILSLMSFLPNPTNMIPSAIAIGILLNTLATSMLIMSKAKGNFGISFVQLQSMALVIAEVGVVLGLMSFLPNPTNMIPSAIAIGILLNTLATSMLIMSKAKGNFGISFVQLQSMALVMVEVAAILSLMSFLPNPTNMIPSAIAIGILLNALAASLLIASLAGPNAAGAATAMKSMGIVLIEVGLVLGLLSAFDINPSIETAAALSILLIAMAAACNIVSKIPVGAGLTGALELAKFIGVMAVVVAAAGAISLIPGVDTLLSGGGDLLGLLGLAIGKFVGGIIEGIAGGIISIIPQLGFALSVFAVGVQPFISLVSGIDSSVIEGAGYLTGAILALTAASFISGISNILTLGQSSLVKLGLELSIFGRYAKIFFDTIKDVDENAVNAATNVGNMILALTASELISTITEKFGGSANFSTMGENLKTFGEAVVEFSDTISGKIDVAAVEAATNAGLLLVELNKSLPRSGGWIQDIIGEQDFGKFAESCKSFATCILAINEVVSQEGFELQSEKIEQLVAAGTAFSTLNKSLPRSDGWLQDIIGEQDLTKFGKSVTAFAVCIIGLNTILSNEKLVIQEDKLTQLATAGTKFSDLNNALPKSDGWLQDVVGEKDLTKFGDAVEHFATCIIGVNEALSQEGFSVNLDGMEDLKQAGLKMNELQEALPKSDGWWQEIAGSQDIGDFGESIKTFADAIVNFSTTSTEIDQGAISSCLSIVNRIKSLMTSLIGLDYSGVEAFTGVGTGGFGADGPAYDIAKAIAKFSDKVADIDTEAVTVAVTAARKLKSLIAGLVGLDTSGIENFKPGEIGKQMKSYADKVDGIDTGVVSSSITSANRLKNFIAGLAGLDTSGIANFKPGSIGSALKTYGNSVSSTNLGAVSSSITAANRLKNFISSLAGLNTSGVGSFKTAINQLSTVNIAGLVKAFSGASAKLQSAGADMINGLVKGMQSKLPAVTAASTKIPTSANKAITSKAHDFATAGGNLATNLAKGISSKKGTVNSAVSSCLSSAASKIRGKYSSFYSAGSYLVTGFANGISANSFRAAAKAKAMANAAEKAARDALKINSPSKVFKEIGSGIPEGLSLGIDEFSDLVTGSISGLSDSAIDAADKLNNLGGDVSLGYGATGDDVKALQTCLEELGHSVGACGLDGIIGPDTTAAIEEFQEAAGLAVTGIAGPETLKALSEAAGEVNNVGDSFSGLLDGVNNVGDSFSGLLDGVDISEYFNLGSDGGTNFIDGIIDGITSNSDHLNGLVGNLGSDLLGSFNGSIDAQSPSRETMKSGKWFCEGIIIGIRNMESSVCQASEGIGQTALNATRSAMSTVLDALNSDMDTQPTIRPVIDLTDVQTGANAIHGLLSGTQTVGVRSNLNAINVAMNRRLQNGTNDDIISAINKLNDGLDGNRGDTYNFAGISYSNGDEVSDAVQTLVRAAKMGRRV